MRANIMSQIHADGTGGHSHNTTVILETSGNLNDTWRIYIYHGTDAHFPLSCWIGRPATMLKFLLSRCWEGSRAYTAGILSNLRIRMVTARPWIGVMLVQLHRVLRRHEVLGRSRRARKPLTLIQNATTTQSHDTLP